MAGVVLGGPGVAVVVSGGFTKWLQQHRVKSKATQEHAVFVRSPRRQNKKNGKLHRNITKLKIVAFPGLA